MVFLEPGMTKQDQLIKSIISIVPIISLTLLRKSNDLFL